MWRILFALPVWLAYLAIDLSLAVVGAIVAVPLAIAFRELRLSPITSLSIITAPRWLWLWGNDEDGYQPYWYAKAHPEWGYWKRMYVWAAIRNSVNNLRFVPGFGVRAAGLEVRSIHRGAFSFYWSWPYARLLYDGKSRRYGVGWKLEHSDPPGGMVGFGFRHKSG